MKYILLLMMFFASCGSNNGTPANTPSPDGDAAPKHPKIDGLDLSKTILSNDGHWRVAVTWNTGPVFSPRPQIENKLQLLFVTPNGAAVDSVKDVDFIPYMPNMGHGLNSKQRIVIGEIGAVAVSELWFNMAGPWQITVKATVDGVADTAVFNADVQSK